MPHISGEKADNGTEISNTTEASYCSMAKVPELTQKCGENNAEEGDTKPVEETKSEVISLVISCTFEIAAMLKVDVKTLHIISS